MSDASPREDREVDPWRFAGSFIAKLLGAAIPDSPKHPEIAWTPLRKPLSECVVALVSTAGISMKDDEPFEMEGERRRPTWGDPSWRALRSGATAKTIAADHLHIDTSYIEADLNVALPLDRLRELEQVSAPAIAQAMVAEGDAVAVLAPV